MNGLDGKFSTKHITPDLISKIVEAVRDKAYGSIEIYVENFSVTQITERTITKLKQSYKNKRFSIKEFKKEEYSSGGSKQE